MEGIVIVAPVAVVASGDTGAGLKDRFEGRRGVDAVRVRGFSNTIASKFRHVPRLAVASAAAGRRVVGLVAVGDDPLAGVDRRVRGGGTGSICVATGDGGRGVD